MEKTRVWNSTYYQRLSKLLQHFSSKRSYYSHKDRRRSLYDLKKLVEKWIFEIEKAGEDALNTQRIDLIEYQNIIINLEIVMDYIDIARAYGISHDKRSEIIIFLSKMVDSWDHGISFENTLINDKHNRQKEQNEMHHEDIIPF